MNVGNLDPKVSDKDLYQLFGLQSTPYLTSVCKCEVVKDENGKSKGFAVVTIPHHVPAEIMNLCGIEFYNRQLDIEESRNSSYAKNYGKPNTEHVPRDIKTSWENTDKTKLPQLPTTSSWHNHLNNNIAVYVGGLSPKSTRHDIITIFKLGQIANQNDSIKSSSKDEVHYMHHPLTS